MSTKETNPKDAVGIKKVPLMSVIPWDAMALVALALFEGARKYGRGNYRAAGVRASVYVDAGTGHRANFWEGEDIDPESGIHHLAKSIASDMVLLAGILRKNWVDDRPLKALMLPRSTETNEMALRIVENVRPNDPEPPYTELTHGSHNSHNTNATSGQSGRHTDKG